MVLFSRLRSSLVNRDFPTLSRLSLSLNRLAKHFKLLVDDYTKSMSLLLREAYAKSKPIKVAGWCTHLTGSILLYLHGLCSIQNLGGPKACLNSKTWTIWVIEELNNRTWWEYDDWQAFLLCTQPKSAEGTFVCQLTIELELLNSQWCHKWNQATTVPCIRIYCWVSSLANCLHLYKEGTTLQLWARFGLR